MSECSVETIEVIEVIVGSGSRMGGEV